MISILQRMGTGLFKQLFVGFIGISFVLLQPATGWAAKITDVRFWSAPDHTRVVLDLTDPIQNEHPSQESVSQFQLELKEASLQTKTRELEVNDPFVKKLKETRAKGTKIVVIDPGHGGEDPGAIGPSRTMEKDIVLQIGQRMARFLRPDHDFKVFLTRKGDYFVPLAERVKVAREVGADLFLSLHADASFNPGARGSSVYCLSLSGATDEAAKILADKENTSNILGGAFAKPVSLNKDPKLNQILLDLMQSNSMKESLRFAEMLLDDLRGVNRLKYSSYRQANFIVLRSPDIPAVLIETSYISNREDERLLSRGDYQDKIAKTVVNTITKFFKQ